MTSEATAHIRGSSMFVLGRVGSLALTLATQVVLVRALSKAGYGAVGYGLAVAVFARTFVSAGHHEVHSRFLALYAERGEPRRLMGFLVMEVVTIGALTVVLLGTAVLAGGFIGERLLHDPEVVPVLLVLLLLAPLEALDRLYESVFAVFARPRAIFFRKYLLTPGLRLLVVAALAVMGAGALFLAIGYVAAGVIGQVAYVVVVVRLLRERGLLAHLRRRHLSYPVREVFTFALPLLSAELVNLTINTATVVLLGFFGTTSEVADLRAVYPAGRLNQLVLWTFAVLFMPLAARLYARDDRAGMRDAYRQSALWVAVATFPIFALTGAMAESTTVVLFGERYRDAAPVLALLSLGWYVNAALGFNALTLQTFGRLRWLLVVNIAAATVCVAGSLLLIPRFGAVGAAVAICVTLISQNLANQAYLGRGVGIKVFDAHAATAYLVIAAGAGGLAVLDRAVHPPFIVAFVAAALVSLLVLLVNRRRLRVQETFPELLRIPGLRRLLSA